MPAAPSSSSSKLEFDAHVGELVPVAPGVSRLTAPNASPYTFTGTNTFIIGTDRVAVLDPGPDDEAHLQAILAAAGNRRIEAILLTHTHIDHCALATRLRAATGAPLVFGGRHRLSRPLKFLERNPFRHASAYDLVPDIEISDGEELAYGGTVLRAVATPGHCANHFAFALEGTNMVLTGDHLMAWNTTLVATPDGSLSDYMASLDRLEALPQTHYIPAHGGEIIDGPARARAVRAHRQMRNGQILEALKKGPMSLSLLALRIYPDVTAKVRIGARRTLLSHLEYLEGRGEVRIDRTILGTRAYLVR